MFQQKKAVNRAMTVNAHRGYSAEYPENTLLAFEKAIELGADYVELDVRECRDGHLVISHDATLERQASLSKRISELTVEQLKTIDVGHGQYTPTLKEVLELCQGKIGIHLEIKEVGLTGKIATLIQDYQMEEDVIFSSFQHIEILRVREILPHCITAICVPATTIETPVQTRIKDLFFDKAELFKANGIHINQIYVDDYFVTDAHTRGYFVNAWNVDSPFMWEAFREMEMDGIFTNEAKKFIEFLEKEEKK
jgi:glycerophosphoryl diester phosphodiesterase